MNENNLVCDLKSTNSIHAFVTKKTRLEEYRPISRNFMLQEFPAKEADSHLVVMKIATCLAMTSRRPDISETW